MRTWYRQIDLGIVIPWFGLVLIGLVAIYSTTHGPASEFLLETVQNNFARQLMWLAICVGLVDHMLHNLVLICRVFPSVAKLLAHCHSSIPYPSLFGEMSHPDCAFRRFLSSVVLIVRLAVRSLVYWYIPLSFYVSITLRRVTHAVSLRNKIILVRREIATYNYNRRARC